VARTEANIKVATAPVGASTELMKTDQTISFRTGDAADLNYGRDASFLVLASDNPFGNSNRFTDTLGTQVYANDIVIDWSNTDGTTIVSGFYRVKQGTNDWNGAIDGALAFSTGGYTSGWYLPNLWEFNSLWKVGGRSLNYIPANGGNSNDRYWTSTTLEGYTNHPAYSSNFFGVGGVPGTQLYYWLPFRRFTYTELGV